MLKSYTAIWTITTIMLLLFLLTVCGTETQAPTAMPGPSVDSVKRDVVANYADGVYSLYIKSLTSATDMDRAIDLFISDPTASSLEAAKRAWLDARDDYGPTEAFRFYGGPIDNEENGPEGLLNAWPMDESYVDYVEGNANAGIINNPAEFPTINASLIESLNEEGGEQNVSTGWHAIEFLLWGQDLNEAGPGSRPLEDYTSDPNAARRAAYSGGCFRPAIGSPAANGQCLGPRRFRQLPG